MPLSLIVRKPIASGRGRTAAVALAWGYGGSVLRMLLQIGAQSILARLLGPEAFGIFAAMMLAAAVAVIAADWISAPLIRAREVTEGTLAFAFACQLTGASVVTILVMALLPVYVSLFPNAEHLAIGLALLATGCFLTALSGLSLSLLRRQLAYRSIQIAQITGYFIGYIVVAIPLALHDTPGSIVLPMAWCVQSMVTAGLMYWHAPHSKSLSFKIDGNQPFLKFGLKITASNLANWLSTSIDKIIVAKFASPVNIGFYSATMNILMTPINQITSSLNTIAYSVSAQQSKESREKSAIAYIGLTAWVSTLLYSALATFPSSLMIVLYGVRWREAGVYVLPFSLVAVGFAISSSVSAIIAASGRAKAITLAHAFSAIGVFVCYWLLAEQDLHRAAYCLAGIFLLRAATLLLLVSDLIGLTPFRSLLLMLTPFGLACLQVALGHLLTHLLHRGGDVSNLVTGRFIERLFRASGILWPQRIVCTPCR